MTPAVRDADLPRLAALAERAARAAGDLVRDQRPADLGVAATKSSSTDVVTEMDTASETLLRSILLDARPDDGILGEEGGLRPGTSGLTWVVDPIDGTVNYLYGLPHFAVSVGLAPSDPQGAADAVDCLVGCVHNPATGQTWTAWRGGGAFLDGRRLGPRPGVELGQALVATGFGYEAVRRAAQAAALARLMPRIRDIRRLGVASLDLCAVACGWVDAYYEQGLKPWDMAAGSLVVREAGARVTGPGGAPPSEQLVVATWPDLHQPLLDLLFEAGAGAAL